jgi:hypothetical protein
MTGWVTERDFAEAEAAFPGIERFYRRLTRKPPTFLDLLRLFLDAADRRAGFGASNQLALVATRA